MTEEYRPPLRYDRGEGQGRQPSTLAADMPGDGDRWTQARQMASIVAAAYRRDPSDRVRKWGERIDDCGRVLTIAYDREGDSYRRQVVEARLCRVRTCPICAWRRAEKLAADLGQAVQRLCQPGGLVPLMLTLTVRNCHVSHLRETLQAMLKGWSLLRRRKVFQSLVVHWTRSIEVTRGRQHIPGDTHPHIHAIIMAHPDEAAALLCADWSSLWQDVMGLSYRPVCHIMPLDVQSRVVEALKYTVKPHDLTRHAVSGWLGAVALALDGVRVLACDEGLRLKEPTGDEWAGGEIVDDLPQGIIPPPGRAPVSVTYHWSGRAYYRGLVMVGYGAEEIRALRMYVTAAYRPAGTRLRL